MPKSYRHLTYEERYQIEALKKSGISIGLIAAQLSRDRTTIYREGATAESVVTVTSRRRRRRRHAASLPRPSRGDLHLSGGLRQ